MKITVYHGATEIIEAPLNHVGRPRLDFGQGFYVTDLKNQAIKWAKTIAEKRAAQPLLNIYTLDRDAILAEARCKIFTAYDKTGQTSSWTTDGAKTLPEITIMQKEVLLTTE